MTIVSAGRGDGDAPNPHDGKSSAEAKAPREYRTGSNLPVKDAASPATAEERECAAEQIRSLQRTGSSGKPQS